MMGQINGIDMSNVAALGGGTSPEEAAKIFMRSAGAGMAKVMRDALIDAVGQAQAGALGAGDWTRFVKGCVLDIQFPNPPGTTIDTETAFAHGADVALGGAEVSIGVSIKF